MRWTPATARDRFAESRVARLATSDAEAHPHLVPVTFAAWGDTIAIAIDHKPKSGRPLKRVANITANPGVCLLADGYSDDWDHLWWARADGVAHVVEDGPEWSDAIDRLSGRYRQYREQPLTGPVIVVRVRRWSGWSFG